MSRPDLLPALYQPGLPLTAAERSVCAAVLMCGTESGGVVMAPLAAVATRCGMTERGLRKMREKGRGEGFIVWAAGVVGVACGTLYRNSVPELCTESGTLYRNSVPDSELCTAGTVLDSRAGVTGLPSYTTYTQASPPTPQGVSGEAEAGPALPDIEAGAETVAAVVSALDADDHAGKPAAFDRLMRALRERGAIVRQRQHGELVGLLASQPTAVIATVGASVARKSGPVHAPVGYVRSLLDDAIKAVQAERVALAQQQAADDRLERDLAERARIASQADDPETRRKAREQFAAMAAALEGG